MNWQLPTLLGQSTEKLEELRKRVEATTLPDTDVPDTALFREGTSNFFRAEYWFPEQASSFAHRVDYLYMAIFWISLAFFVAIIGFMIYFCVKYQRRGNVINPLPSPSHNTGIEILWSVLPSILLVWIFYEGASGYFEMRVPKEEAEEIQVMASRYNWLFTYPDGDSSAELHLVMDRPTKLIMQSKDVLHSLFIPAFRQKMDIVPGRYTYAYLMPSKIGKYRLSCTEYCGEGHSRMRTMAQVHMTSEARKTDTQWIRAKFSAWKNGEHIYNIRCSGCHKIDGTAATGPALNLIWGTDENLHNGATVKVNEQYVQDSIWFPEKDVVKGFGPVSKMNSFKGQLKEEDINDVIAFLKHLKDPASVSDDPIGDQPAVGAKEGNPASVPAASTTGDALKEPKTAPAEKPAEAENKDAKPDLSGPDENDK